MHITSLVFNVLPFIYAFFIALGLCALAVLFANSAKLAMGTMVAVFLLDAVTLTPHAIKLGIWVYLPDMLVVLLLPAFFYRLVSLKKFAVIPAVWWLLGVVWLALFVWGLTQYGTGAGVDFRPFCYVWLGSAFLATFDYDEAFARGMMKFFVIMGAGVCVIAYSRWTLGAMDDQFYRELERFDATGVALLRVIPAGQAFILSCALLVVVYQATTKRTQPLALLLSAVFLVTVVALQHRTVWVASCAGFVALALALRRMRTGAGAKLFPMLLVAITILSLIAFSGRFQGAVDSVEDQAVRAISTTSGTFVGRVVGWQALLKTWASSGSPVTYLVGHPFGSGYQRYGSDFGSVKVGYVPHNVYMLVLYRGGLIGLFAFIWIFAQAATILWIRLKREEKGISPLLFAMLIAQLVYYIPYEMEFAQMLLLGLLLGVINSERKYRTVQGRMPFELKAKVPSGSDKLARKIQSATEQ
jgi:hypothetical protein